MHPRKLYVETTTRCNLQCGMCVRHAPGSRIIDRDLDLALFHRLQPLLPHLDALVLNGIGEPLLHPQLPEMIAVAARTMASSGWIGLQSNGVLLDRRTAATLFDAGLTRLCLSVDSAGHECHDSRSLLHPVSARRQSPLTLARDVCRQLGFGRVRLGAEIVLTRATIAGLPGLVERLIDEGADFILATHLLAYQPEAEAQSVFQPNTIEAWQLYAKWRKLAAAEGLAIDSLTARTWIAPRNHREQRLQQLYGEMMAEARRRGIWLNVPRLAAWEPENMGRWQELLTEAETLAGRAGVDISLPPLAATTRRSCPFMEEAAMLVDATGEVHPCHPLWHSHTLYQQGEAKHLAIRPFGTLIDEEPLAIWQNSSYRDFRRTARTYDYPFCHGCANSPCPDITGEPEPLIQDCFGNPVPCGHCLWGLGAIRCL